MSVSQVPMWTVRCDVDPRHVHAELGHVPTMFYSYESAISLAKLDGWVFDNYRAHTGHTVLCPECAKGA